MLDLNVILRKRQPDYSRVIARVGELLREHANEEYGVDPVGLAAVRKAVFLSNDGHPKYQKCNRPAVVRPVKEATDA